MSRLLFLPLVLAAFTALAKAEQANPPYSESLRFSCFDKPFLSISAHSPKHDRFPDIQLEVTDGLGQRAGYGNYQRRIPESHYGKIAEIPKAPDRSRAVAVEVCNAKPGRYTFTVSEHGNFPYRISVTRDDGTGSNTGNETRIICWQSNEDRVCRLSFDFLVSGGKVTIRWLDKENHPLPFAVPPGCDPVPRA